MELSTYSDVVYVNANPSFLYPISSVRFALLSLVEFGCLDFFRLGFVLAYSVSLLSYVGSSFVLLLAILPLSFKYSKETYSHRTSSVPQPHPTYWSPCSLSGGKPLCQLQTFLARWANNRFWSIMNHWLGIFGTLEFGSKSGVVCVSSQEAELLFIPCSQIYSCCLWCLVIFISFAPLGSSLHHHIHGVFIQDDRIVIKLISRVKNGVGIGCKCQRTLPMMWFSLHRRCGEFCMACDGWSSL